MRMVVSMDSGPGLSSHNSTSRASDFARAPLTVRQGLLGESQLLLSLPVVATQKDAEALARGSGSSRGGLQAAASTARSSKQRKRASILFGRGLNVDVDLQNLLFMVNSLLNKAM